MLTKSVKSVISVVLKHVAWAKESVQSVRSVSAIVIYRSNKYNIGGARTCGISLLGAAFHNGCIYLFDLQIVLGVG